MKCYHMTTTDRLDSIEKMGLLPKNGRNSKLINDKKKKVFFSEGYAGAIALFVDFNIVYDKIKNKEIQLEDKEVNNLVCKSNLVDIKECNEGFFKTMFQAILRVYAPLM